MKRGEVWWVSFDPSVGGEIQKTRPAVIVSNDSVNQFLNRVQVVPLTGNTLKIYPSEVIVTVKGKSSKAIADQITTASKKRFKSYIASLSPEEMLDIDRAIRLQLALS